MAEQEYLEVLDEHGEKTGERVTYDEAHSKGLRHRSVQIALVDSKKEILLQKRGAHMRAYPNHWEWSASGHVSAGKTSLEAAKQETKEELGLDLPDEAFEYLFTVEQRAVLNDGTFKLNEVQDLYLVRRDVDVTQLAIGKNEVKEVKWFTEAELRSLMNGEGEPFVPHQSEYEKFFEILSFQ